MQVSKPGKDTTTTKLYAAMTLSYVGAMLASNHSLQYVAYPTQVWYFLHMDSISKFTIACAQSTGKAILYIQWQLCHFDWGRWGVAFQGPEEGLLLAHQFFFKFCTESKLDVSSKIFGSI